MRSRSDLFAHLLMLALGWVVLMAVLGACREASKQRSDVEAWVAAHKAVPSSDARAPVLAGSPPVAVTLTPECPLEAGGRASSNDWRSWARQ